MRIINRAVPGASRPAGMEAARVAALRGHKVVLYERGRELGGLLPFAAIFNPEIGKLDKYLRNQIKKLRIKVELGEEFTPASIEEVKPDVLILAMGGSHVPSRNSRERPEKRH